MISLSVPSDCDSIRETITFDAVAEAEAFLDLLELREDDGHASFELMAAILQLREAIAKAKEAGR
ncbi:MAG: hypothetical protein ACO326_09485 [Burkholderiaceae bacterium]